MMMMTAPMCSARASAAHVQAQSRPSWADNCCGAVGPPEHRGLWGDRACAAKADTLETPSGVSVPR
eukprot:7618651-Alexandrium_andersonii.AAC.1